MKPDARPSPRRSLQQYLRSWQAREAAFRRVYAGRPVPIPPDAYWFRLDASALATPLAAAAAKAVIARLLRRRLVGMETEVLGAGAAVGIATVEDILRDW